VAVISRLVRFHPGEGQKFINVDETVSTSYQIKIETDNPAVIEALFGKSLLGLSVGVWHEFF
jgi:hypothetical protein